MGPGLLRAGYGARLRRLEAWLLLPDARLLHERGGTEPGESRSISTHARIDTLNIHKYQENWKKFESVVEILLTYAYFIGLEI